jgi:hypothetical protein
MALAPSQNRVFHVLPPPEPIAADTLGDRTQRFAGNRKADGSDGAHT